MPLTESLANPSNITPGGILVKPGQVWQYFDWRKGVTKVKVIRVSEGKAYLADALTGKVRLQPKSISNMTPPGKNGRYYQLITK